MPSVDLIAVRVGTGELLARLDATDGLDTAMKFMAEAFRLVVTGKEREIEIAIRRHVDE